VLATTVEPQTKLRKAQRPKRYAAASGTRSILLSLAPLLSSTLILATRQEALMESSPFPEIPCVLCSKAVDLRTDLCADENGKAVHSDCYFTHVTSNHGPKLREGQKESEMSDSPPSKAFIEFVNSASTHWATNSCPACGTELKYRDCAFFYEGQTWEIPLPICGKCHPIAHVNPPHDA
jgi:hypothetical protein